VIWQPLPDDESIFLDTRNDSYFALDAIGTATYRALVDADTIEAACESLLRQYDVEPARLRRDIRDFVARLTERRLLDFRP
jgi:hypothetical protein